MMAMKELSIMEIKITKNIRYIFPKILVLVYSLISALSKKWIKKVYGVFPIMIIPSK
jgi:hypothetical protein